MARVRSTHAVVLAFALTGALLFQERARAAAEGFLDAVSSADLNAKTAARAVEAAVGACQESFLDERPCLADALNDYSDELRYLALPSNLQGLPGITWRAAHRLRDASTKAEASKAIEIGIQEIRRTTARLAADDHEALAAEARDGSDVAEALTIAEEKVQKAIWR